MITGAELKSILREAGISQKKCAEKVKLPEPYISEYVNNRRNLKQDELARIECYADAIRAIL